MKVVAFNGSPRKNGNTETALRIVLGELEKAGIETELIQVGKETIRGCVACHACIRKQDERCGTDSDPVNEWIQKMKEADGILLGSPVYFSGASGQMKAFLDRAFFVSMVNGALLRHKVGAAVVAVRRSGGIPTLDTLNHFINYAEMMMPASNYWSVAHGLQPGEVEQDAEGMQIMEVLGRNMAWLMKVMEAGKREVPPPEAVQKVMTNFVR
jgi:multimeric flavodoxin WrbA